MMKSRFIMKRNTFVLIGIVLVVYLLTTILFVPEFLTHYSYSNAYAGKHAYSGPVSSDQDQEHVKSMLQHLLSVSTVIRDYRFVDSSIFWIQEKSQTEKTFTISWMNKPNWLSLQSLNHFLGRRCTYKNCKMTEYKHNTSHPDALVFNTKNQLPSSSLSVFKLRPGTQVWIFFQMEPPSRITTNWFRQESFRYAFNWSWSYRLDSDIFRPIGTFIRNTGFSNISYSAIFQKKTKMAAWIVSHCETQSLREKFVSSLIREGVQVDIFGRCSQTGQREKADYIMNKISHEYKFYLAFENSFCEDYVTEKFFTYYNLDVILIVRGGFNYSNFFDKSTFIDTSDFGSVKQLAIFLKELGGNEKAYTRYLLNKERFTLGFNQWDTMQYSSCALCAKLNNVDTFPNIYRNIEAFVSNDTCTRPNDYY